MAWTYSDWITYDLGSSTRLQRLRLHIQEVSDAISTPSHKLGEYELKAESLQKYLESLEGKEINEATLTDLAGGSTIGFSRGRARPE